MHSLIYVYIRNFFFVFAFCFLCFLDEGRFAYNLFRNARWKPWQGIRLVPNTLERNRGEGGGAKKILIANHTRQYHYTQTIKELKIIPVGCRLPITTKSIKVVALSTFYQIITIQKTFFWIVHGQIYLQSVLARPSLPIWRSRWSEHTENTGTSCQIEIHFSI